MAGRKASTFPEITPKSTDFVMGLDLTQGDQELQNVRYDMAKMSRTSQTTVEVFSLADLPAESGGKITLTSARYLFKNSLTFTVPLEAGILQIVTLDSDDADTTTLTYSGNDTFLINNGSALYTIKNMNLKLTGTSSKLFDILGFGALLFNQVFCNGASGTNVRIGDINNGFALGIIECDFDGFADNQITILNPAIVNISRSRWINGAGIGPILEFDGIFTDTTTIEIAECVFVTAATESVMSFALNYFDSKGTIRITNCSNTGIGKFYEVGTNTPIASMTDKNEDIVISSVSDNGGIAVFNASVAFTDVQLGDIIKQTNFDVERSYNGNYIVTTIGASTYELSDLGGNKITFAGPDDGDGRNILTQMNSVAHGLLDSEATEIVNSASNNGIFRVRSKTNDDFVLRTEFIANDTGASFSRNSLDQTAIPLNVQRTKGSPNSMTVSEARTSANFDITGGSVTGTDVPIQSSPLVFGDWIEEFGTERFTTDRATGATVYIGDEDITAQIQYQGTFAPIGGNQQLEITIRINNIIQGKSLVDFTTASVLKPVFVGGLFPLKTGDRIQLFKKNTTNSNDTNVSFASLLVAAQ